MKVILNELGEAISDIEVIAKAHAALQAGLFHVSNEQSVAVMRCILKKMPVEERPIVEWEFYGKTVHFDVDLRSPDAWTDKVNVVFDFLTDLL